jgi:CubicO group peptidase (beta-lactamase class C family)
VAVPLLRLLRPKKEPPLTRGPGRRSAQLAGPGKRSEAQRTAARSGARSEAQPSVAMGPEVEPREAGLRPRDVEAIWSAVRDLYATRTQPAIALCVMRRGQVVIDRAIGHARGGPLDPKTPAREATPDTPFCLFSVSKAITAMLIHHLDDRGLLHLDDPVAEYIPEFGCFGKERITVRHVLTHRAGIPSVAGHNDPDLFSDWPQIIELLCHAEPVWVPGRRLAYHAITGGYVLGEIVHRVTGKDLREVLDHEVRRHLGFRWFNYGVAPEELDEVAHSRFTGPTIPPGAAYLAKRALGVPFQDAVQLSNDARFLTSVVPSGNIVGTARELATFFDLLLSDGEVGRVRVFDRRTVRRALTETSYLEVDLTLGFPVRYGLGFMLGTKRFSPFGPKTPRAYGHYGFTTVVGWADPERRIAAALVTSGKAFLGSYLVKFWRVLGAIAERCPRVA